jgi:cell division protein FtsI (penicillin-binding protein 3)
MKILGGLIRGLKPALIGSAPAGRTHMEFEGIRKAQGAQAKNRIIIVIACFGLIYSVIGARLVQYGLRAPETVSSIARADQLMASRPDLLDRNGEVLATDIRTVSLFGEPRRIVDATRRWRRCPRCCRMSTTRSGTASCRRARASSGFGAN